MTRGVRTTLVLFIVLAGLVAFVVYSNNTKTAEPTAFPSTYLWDMTADQVSEVQVINNSRQLEMTLTLDNQDQWQVESSKVTNGQVVVPAQPADPGQGAYGASLVSTIYLSRTLTETTELGEYGLMAPAYAIRVALADGTKMSVKVGYKTPTGDGYYVLAEGAAHPQIVTATALDPLFAFVDNPPILPSPTPAETATPEGTPGSETATPAP